MNAVRESRFSAGLIANRFAYCVNNEKRSFLFFTLARDLFFIELFCTSNSEIPRSDKSKRTEILRYPNARVCARAYVRAHARCPVLISVDKYLSLRTVYFGRLGKDITQLNFCLYFLFVAFISSRMQSRMHTFLQSSMRRWYCDANLYWKCPASRVGNWKLRNSDIGILRNVSRATTHLEISSPINSGTI